MTGSFKPAVRAGVGLLVGIAGPTGSGKTFSALRLARGLAEDDDSAIAFIDTEAGRALHYAAAKGETPTATTFGFSHAELTAPFTPERYLALIEEAEKAGFKVIVIDSFSHEWDGEGGLVERHDEIHEKMGGQDKQSIAAWKEPKLRHKRLVSRLLQCRAHLVICMRAEDKLRMDTVEQTDERSGRTFKKAVITQAKDLPPTQRWTPICERRFPYELITSLVLSPDNPGVPIPLKLQEQHRAFVPVDRALDESAGRALAAWARGHQSPQSAAPQRPLTHDAGGSPPPASSSSSTFPADFVKFGSRRIDPACPEELVFYDDMDEGEWNGWSAGLRKLIERAPDDATKLAWERANQGALLILSTRWPARRAWTLEILPRSNSAGLAGPADGDAPDSPLEGRSGASSTEQQRSA